MNKTVTGAPSYGAGQGERPGVLGCALQALHDTLGRPALLAALYGVNLLATMAIWQVLAWILEPALGQHPEPDLFGWVALLRTNPELWVMALLAVTAVCGAYFLCGAAVAGAALEQLGGGSALRGAWRHLLRMLGLRLLLVMPVCGIVALWAVLGHWQWEASLELVDDRGPLLLQAALGLVMAPPLVWLLASYHYAQVAVVQGAGPLRAWGGAVRLLWRRPRACLGLWLLGWVCWVGVTLAFGTASLTHPLAVQVAVVARVVIHLWSLAAARRLAFNVGMSRPAPLALK